MFRLAKWLPAAMGLAVAVTLTVAAPARADIIITLSESGYTTQTVYVPSGTLGGTSGPVTIGQYNVTVDATDSAPGLNLLGLATLTQNTISVAATATPLANLVITVSDSTFNNFAPGGIALVGNALSTTEIDAGTVAATSSLNEDNTPSASLTGPLGPTSPSNELGATSSAVLSFGDGSTFALDSTATVSGMTYNTATGVGSIDNFTITTDAQPLPEPATLVTAIAAMPFLGLGAWLRRRKQVA